jgi:hypothetical protein
METKVKSGKEVLDDFFNDLPNLANVDSAIANSLVELYKNDKLSDTNIKNSLSKLRENNGNENK